jgi:hypothetical protein
MAREQYSVGTIATLMSTELDSLANNTTAIASGTYTNTNGNPWGLFELVCQYGTAPTANTVIGLWLLSAIDGTNYEDGSGIEPARSPDVMWRVRAVTTAQRVTVVGRLRPGIQTPLARNLGTGQTLASSGNTIKVLPYTFEGV